MTTKAEQFKEDNKDYFFEDAHFMVEANAKSVANEVAYNIFVFEDESVMRIVPNQSVATYASIKELEHAIAKMTAFA